MKIPKLQLGLTSEHGAFNGNIAYAEGSTAENPKSMIQFFGLPNNRTAEQLAEIPECAEAWAFARHVVTASNERDALRAQVAAMEAELAKVREVASENFKYLQDRVSALHDKNVALAAALKPFADFFEGDLTNVGGGTETAPTFKIQNFKDAKAAIAAAEGGAE